MAQLSRTLSLALGAAVLAGAVAGSALQLPKAFAYPAGAAVSYGANPVWSLAGTPQWYWNGSSNPIAYAITVPADQDLVITDLSLTAANNYQAQDAAPYSQCQHVPVTGVLTATGSGTILAAAHATAVSPAILSMSGGVRVPAGTSATWTVSASSCGSYNNYGGAFILSGYYAAP